jgi:hypothetical protein
VSIRHRLHYFIDNVRPYAPRHEQVLSSIPWLFGAEHSTPRGPTRRCSETRDLFKRLLLHQPFGLGPGKPVIVVIAIAVLFNDNHMQALEMRTEPVTLSNPQTKFER